MLESGLYNNLVILCVLDCFFMKVKINWSNIKRNNYEWSFYKKCVR